jgi:hypothetical protein
MHFVLDRLRSSRGCAKSARDETLHTLTARRGTAKDHAGPCRSRSRPSPACTAGPTERPHLSLPDDVCLLTGYSMQDAVQATRLGSSKCGCHAAKPSRHERSLSLREECPRLPFCHHISVPPLISASDGAPAAPRRLHGGMGVRAAR